jgi:hypothetical protein
MGDALSCVRDDRCGAPGLQGRAREGRAIVKNIRKGGQTRRVDLAVRSPMGKISADATPKTVSCSLQMHVAHWQGRMLPQGHARHEKALKS